MVSKRTTKRSSDTRSKKRTKGDYLSVPRSTGTTSVRMRPADDEKRFYDTYLVNADVNTAGFVVSSLNLLSQGSGQGQRIGSKATICNLNINCRFTLRAATIQDITAGAATVRMIVGIDTECRGAQPNVSDVLNLLGVGPDPNGVTHCLSFRNYPIASRFRILKDKLFNLNASGSGNNGTLGGVTMEVEKVVKVSKKLNLRVDFNNAAGATDITAVQGNNIFVMFVSDGPNTTPADTGGKVAVDMIARIKYYG